MTRSSLLILTCSLHFLGTLRSQDLLVSRYLNEDVLRYDGITGSFLGTLVQPQSGGLSRPGELAIGPDLQLYVSSYTGNAIFKFDRITGAFLSKINAGGLNGPRGIAFGPDGNLYVSDTVNNRIARYDPITGSFLGTIPTTTGAPIGLRIGADSLLYAAIASPVNRVERFNVMTSTSLGYFTPSGRLNNPQSLVFGTAGDLFVHSQNDYDIVRFDGTTGAFKQIFINQNYPFNPSAGLAFGPGGNLYTTNLTAGHLGENDGIDRYNGTTGAFIDHFINAPTYGQYWSNGLLFVSIPEPGTVMLLFVISGLVLLLLIYKWKSKKVIQELDIDDCVSKQTQ